MFGLASPALSLIPPMFLDACDWSGSCSVIGENYDAAVSRDFHIVGATAPFATALIIRNRAVSGNARTSLVVNRVNACWSSMFGQLGLSGDHLSDCWSVRAAGAYCGIDLRSR